MGYPASDIPQIARRLFVRVLVDVEAAPVLLTPRLSPFTHQDLDMSMCFPCRLHYFAGGGDCDSGCLATAMLCRVIAWGTGLCYI